MCAARIFGFTCAFGGFVAASHFLPFSYAVDMHPEAQWTHPQHRNLHGRFGTCARKNKRAGEPTSSGFGPHHPKRYQKRLSDLIGPYWGYRTGIVYRVTQPVFGISRKRTDLILPPMAAELLMHGDPLPNLRDREGSGSQIPPPFGHSRLPIPSLRVHLHLLDVPGARTPSAAAAG